MAKLILQILLLFKDKGFIYDSIRILSYGEVRERVVRVTNYLNKLSNERQVKIALIATNSIDWIICFLAILISKHHLVLISPYLTTSKIKKAVMDSNVDIIITSKDFNIDMFPLCHRVFRINYISNISSNNERNGLKKSLDESILENQETNFSSKGITIISPRKLSEIRISKDNINDRLKILTTKNIFPDFSTYVAYLEFTYNYVICLLLPLIHGCIIRIPEKRSEYSIHALSRSTNGEQTVIITGRQFENLYKKFIEDPRNIFSNLLKYFHLWIIRKRILKNRLKKEFPNLRMLIILNSRFSLSIERTLKLLKFPFTITYGTVETSGIASFSLPNEFVVRSCGQPLFPSEVSYYKDDSLFITNNNLFFIGRNNEYIRIRNSKGEEVLISRSSEDILRHLPFVDDCILIEDNNNIHLFITLDYKLVEEVNISRDDIKQLLKDSINRLNRSKVIQWYIHSIVIVDGDFRRDSYDRILSEHCLI